MTWLYNNLATIVVGLIVFGVVAFIAVKMIKDKRQGKSCCNGCAGCALKDECSANKNNQ